MRSIPLEISGAYIFEPKIFEDSRGKFFELFQSQTFASNIGVDFQTAQVNCSISAKGVIRGIHFAKYPPGQAKFVTCLTGSVFDVLVDLRIGSKSFGKWISVEIDSRHPKAVYIPSGIGHAFMALEDNTTFVYLCDQIYDPANEFDISPFDQKLKIDWPNNVEFVLSDKDKLGGKFEDLYYIYPKFQDM